MKAKNFIVGGAILVMTAIVVTSMMDFSVEGSNQITGYAVAPSENSGDVQEVTLTFENYRYKVSEPLQKGVPVRMVVDLTSVTGCMRDVVIPTFGVRKYVKAGDNVIEFTPDKAGTINIACSMNMGRGTFEVVESDGSESTFIDAAIPEAAGEGASCGGSGGCGCGGTPYV